MRFTVAAIRTLKPKARPYNVTESGRTGLCIRVLPTGTMTYQFRYTRPAGKRTAVSIGDVGTVNLVDARAQAALYRQAVRRGEDPARLRQQERDKERAIPTLEDLWELFHSDMQTPRKRRLSRGKKGGRQQTSDPTPLPAATVLPTEKGITPIAATTLYNYDGLWKRCLKPEFGDSDITAVTRSQVREMFVKVSKRGATEANQAVALLRRLFNYAIDDLDGFGGLENNPALRFKKNEELPCDRVLSAREIARSWAGFGEVPREFGGNKYDSRTQLGERRAAAKLIVGLSLRLMLATMQRGIDVRLMQDSHLDEEERYWTIPAVYFKTKLPHRVPLGDLALEIIDQARKLRPKECPFVFGSPITGLPFSQNSLARRVSRGFENWGVGYFTPHDLRRTASTLAVDAGADTLHTDILQGHYPTGIRRVYNLYAYDRQKRAVVNIWEDKLLAVIKGRDRKVIPLRTRDTP